MLYLYYEKLYFYAVNKQFFIDNTSRKVTLDNKSYQSAQGHLRVDALVTKVGVLPYWDSVDKKIIHVLRHPDQVFDSLSLQSLAGIPVTVSHPIENGKAVLVTPENFSKYGKGVVGDAINVVNPYVKIDGLNIQDITALRALKKGNKQLSPGYEVDRVPEDGVFEGIKYTHRQYGIPVEGHESDFILYNHLAIMDVGENGRSGPNVKVLMESDSLNFEIDSEYLNSQKSQIFDFGKFIEHQKEKKKMSEFIELLLDSEGKQKRILQVDDGQVTVNATDLQTIMSTLQQLVQQVTSLNQAEAAEQQQMAPTGLDSVENLVKAYLTVKGEKEALQLQVDKTSTVTVDNDAIAAKLTLINTVKPYLPKETTFDSLVLKSDRDLKIELLKQWDANIAIDSDTPDPTIDGMYRIAKDALDKVADKTKKSKQQLNTDSNDTKVPVSELTTDEMKQETSKRLKLSRMPARMQKKNQMAM